MNTKEEQVEKIKKEMIMRRNVLHVIPKIIDSFSNDRDRDMFIAVCKEVNPKVIEEIAYYGKELMNLGFSKEEVIDMLIVKT